MARWVGVSPTIFFQQLAISLTLLAPLWTSVESITVGGFRWEQGHVIVTWPHSLMWTSHDQLMRLCDSHVIITWIPIESCEWCIIGVQVTQLLLYTQLFSLSTAILVKRRTASIQWRNCTCRAAGNILNPLFSLSINTSWCWVLWRDQWKLYAFLPCSAGENDHHTSWCIRVSTHGETPATWLLSLTSHVWFYCLFISSWRTKTISCWVSTTEAGE